MPGLYRSVLVLLCLSIATLIGTSTSAAAFKEVHTGDTAPSFTLPDLDGTPVSLDDHKDSPLTIVTFWALWSPKSEPLLQDIQKILEEFGDKGVVVKAIAVNEDGDNVPADFTDQVKGLIERNHLQFSIVVDRGMEEYARWGVIATPSTAFLGKGLKVEYEFSGHPTSAYMDMREQAMKILGLEETVAAAAKPKRERYQADHRVLLNYGLTKTLFERGQFSKAQRKLNPVLTADPNFPDAAALNGYIHLALAQGGEADASATARAAFDKAVELDPTVPTGLIGQAHFALQDGDTAKALERAQEAVKYTETEDLPQIKAAEGAADAPATEAAAAPGAAATEPPAGEEPATTTDPAPQLIQAAALLAAGDEASAKALVTEYVAAYLAIPEGPSMSGKGMQMKMMMMKQQEAQ